MHARGSFQGWLPLSVESRCDCENVLFGVRFHIHSVGEVSRYPKSAPKTFRDKGCQIQGAYGDCFRDVEKLRVNRYFEIYEFELTRVYLVILVV